MKSSVSPATVRFLLTRSLARTSHFTDIAVVGKTVVDFYTAKGGEVVSPWSRTFRL